LTAALSHAHAGDVIKLAAGNYTAPLVIQNFNPGGSVTITSADPNSEAVLGKTKIVNSSGLNFTNVEFSFPLGDGTAGPVGITIRGSDSIHFTNDNIHGVLGAAPTNDMRGMDVSQSSDIQVVNSQFQDLFSAMSMGKSSNITVTGNNIHDIRVDGFEGAADTNVNISNNVFTDFHHIGYSGVVDPVTGKQGDHSDAIQFWTTGQTQGSSNLTITNNVITQGSGRDMQGIFIQDSVGTLPYQNVTVTGNLIVGGNWNGIMVDHAHGLNLSNNTVDTLSTQTQSPWIKVMNSTGANLVNNAAKSFGLAQNNTGLVQTNDHLNTVVTDGGLGALGSWMLQHPNSTLSLLGLHASDLSSPLTHA
jgi:hypothetical protein